MRPWNPCPTRKFLAQLLLSRGQAYRFVYWLGEMIIIPGSSARPADVLACIYGQTTVVYFTTAGSLIASNCTRKETAVNGAARLVMQQRLAMSTNART